MGASGASWLHVGQLGPGTIGQEREKVRMDGWEREERGKGRAAKKEEDKMCRLTGDGEEKVPHRGVYRSRLGPGEASRTEDGELHGARSDYAVGQPLWKAVWE